MEYWLKVTQILLLFWTRSQFLFWTRSQLPRLCFQPINHTSLLWLRGLHYRIWKIQNHCSKFVHKILPTSQRTSLGWEMKNENIITPLTMPFEVMRQVWQQCSFKFTFKETLKRRIPKPNWKIKWLPVYFRYPDVDYELYISFGIYKNIWKWTVLKIFQLWSQKCKKYRISDSEICESLETQELLNFKTKELIL